MKSIICGAGDVGYSIADKLSKETFEVTVVDESKEMFSSLENNILDFSDKTITLKWYNHIKNDKSLLEKFSIDGKFL